jgi:hypothetical protein
MRALESAVLDRLARDLAQLCPQYAIIGGAAVWVHLQDTLLQTREVEDIDILVGGSTDVRQLKSRLLAIEDGWYSESGLSLNAGNTRTDIEVNNSTISANDF